MRVIMVFMRHKLLLALVKLSERKVSRLQIVKQAFLLRQHLSSDYARRFYEFLPYDWGPFSFTLYHDLQKMADSGLLTFPSDKTIEATEHSSSVSKSLEPRLRAELYSFWEAYGNYRVGQLLDLVYENYPWYASRSKRGRQNGLEETAKCEVYTIGYEGMQLDGFLNVLLASGIQTIVDVRKNAVSRVYGFHGSTLASVADRLGIKYRHVPELGIPSAWRADPCSGLELDTLFSKYRGEVIPLVEGTIDNVASIVCQKPSVLMCLESNPAKCHRSVLAEYVSRVSGLSISDLR